MGLVSAVQPPLPPVRLGPPLSQQQPQPQPPPSVTGLPFTGKPRFGGMGAYKLAGNAGAVMISTSQAYRKVAASDRRSRQAQKSRNHPHWASPNQLSSKSLTNVKF